MIIEGALWSKLIVRTGALMNDAKHMGLDAHQATIFVASQRF
jgi:hypothetical protein